MAAEWPDLLRGANCDSIGSDFLFNDIHRGVFCNINYYTDGIIEEEVTSAQRIIICDPVIPWDLKVKRFLIVKSCCAIVYNREINYKDGN